MQPHFELISMVLYPRPLFPSSAAAPAAVFLSPRPCILMPAWCTSATYCTPGLQLQVRQLWQGNGRVRSVERKQRDHLRAGIFTPETDG